MKYKRLGDMLIDMGIITDEQLSYALSVQKETKERLGQVLLKNNLITEHELTHALEEQLGIDYIDLKNIKIDSRMASYIPRALAESAQMIPVRVQKDTLFLAMADPMNFMAAEQAKDVSRMRIVPMVANQTAVENAIRDLYGRAGEEKAKQPAAHEEISGQIPDNASGDREYAAAGLLEELLRENSVLLHLEFGEKETQIRERIHGRMQTVRSLSFETGELLWRYLADLCRLDTASGLPAQTGRGMLKLPKGCTVLQIDVLTTDEGRELVLRADRAADGTVLPSAVDSLEEEQKRELDRLLGRSGLILVTAPGRNGLTTTLRGMLSRLNAQERQIFCIQGHAAGKLPGITRITVQQEGRDDVSLSYAGVLRRVLQMDPDVICIDELADAETARLAADASLSGVTVIAGIHAVDAAGAVERLRCMGLSSGLLAAGLRGITEQRLVRRICPQCSETYIPEEAVLAELNACGVHKGKTWWHGSGCDACLQSGCSGQSAVIRIIKADPALREQIRKEDSPEILREMCRTGIAEVPLFEKVLQLAVEGTAGVEEVLSASEEIL